METTLRKMLNEVDFNWENAFLVFQTLQDRELNIKWMCPEEKNKFDLRNGQEECDILREMLDYKFDAGFGGDEAPHFIADDGESIYYLSEYDGSISLTVVFKDIDNYLNLNNGIPR